MNIKNRNDLQEILTQALKEVMTFCKLNAWKYRYRAGDKGDAQVDKAKSDWYMKKYQELKGFSEELPWHSL